MKNISAEAHETLAVMEHGKPYDASTLARLCSISTSAAHGRLGKLHQLGLIERVAVGTYQRADGMNLRQRGGINIHGHHVTVAQDDENRIYLINACGETLELKQGPPTYSLAVPQTTSAIHAE